MMDDTFAAQYRNPMWQKKRLEALEEAGFECQNCGSQDKQLHVHHRRYVKGRKVWEYDNPELVVLCEKCHETLHKQKDFLQHMLSGYTDILEIVCVVSGFLHGIRGDKIPDNTDDIPPLYWAGFMASKLNNTDSAFILSFDKKVNQLYKDWIKEQQQKNNVSNGEENNGQN